MPKLLKYHTVQANPEYFWENNQVAIKLKNKQINTYEEYEKACKLAGCICYNEDCFNDYLKGE
jgi:hypothetical protein